MATIFWATNHMPHPSDYSGGSPSMELTAAHRESGGALAQRTLAGLGFAPLTLPV